jgi:hypothetical protein
MALLQLSQHLLNDPQTVKAIYNTFETVEEASLSTDNLQNVKTFRVTGQGVPLDDRHILVGFSHGLDGITKIDGWSHANQ